MDKSNKKTDKKLKILIIGKNGFVSRNLSDYFKKSEDYDIRVVSSGEFNLLDELSVRDFLLSDYYDVVIDTAIYNPRVGSGKDPYKELEYDLCMFHNLARCHRKYGKLIYFGSGAEYDKRFPICSVVEDDLMTNGIETVSDNRCSGQIPTTQYGLAKYIIGQEIEAGIYGADNIYNLRIFGLFGKYENWKTTFISGACCKAMKNLPITIRQNVYFDYLYIKDFCKMLELFINIDKPKYHTYNITSGRRISLVEIADIVKAVSGKDVPVYVCKEGMANEYSASNRRLMDEIGEIEFTDMTDSIEELYNYYNSINDDISLIDLLY